VYLNQPENNRISCIELSPNGVIQIIMKRCRRTGTCRPLS